MKGFILSFRSEFYKTRKTMAFWSAVILPLLLCLLVTIGFYLHKSDGPTNTPPMLLWVEFSAIILAPMGSLILPMLVVFVAYSVNSIEHKADTWKTLFSLPIPKLSVYAAKYLYAFFLIFLCLMLFVLFTVSFGNLLGVIKPQLKFGDYSVAGLLTKLYFKLFLSSLGILSIQFLLSLLFRDFLKPMGIGFVCAITGMILAGNRWKYAYWFPYSHPMLTIQSLIAGSNAKPGPGGMPVIEIDIFSKEIFVSLGIALVVFVAGYFIVLKKSVK
jgi:hypothetical protein